MTVTLKIEVTSPLTDDDRDLLAGLAVMTVAIANRQINQYQEEQPAEPEPEPQEARPCGSFEYTRNGNTAEVTGRVCVNDVGHGGRHRYRHPTELPAAYGAIN